jgi:hypothetical protein
MGEEGRKDEEREAMMRLEEVEGFKVTKASVTGSSRWMDKLGKEKEKAGRQRIRGCAGYNCDSLFRTKAAAKSQHWDGVWRGLHWQDV